MSRFRVKDAVPDIGSQPDVAGERSPPEKTLLPGDAAAAPTLPSLESIIADLARKIDATLVIPPLRQDSDEAGAAQRLGEAFPLNAHESADRSESLLSALDRDFRPRHELAAAQNASLTREEVSTQRFIEPAAEAAGLSGEDAEKSLAPSIGDAHGSREKLGLFAAAFNKRNSLMACLILALSIGLFSAARRGDPGPSSAPLQEGADKPEQLGTLVDGDAVRSPKTRDARRDAQPGGRSAAGAADYGAQDLATVQKLAAQGQAGAQHELGTRFMKGRGVTHDTESAARWFEKAAKQGFGPAQYVTAFFYEHAIGVARDLSRARDYYRLAAENGDARAMQSFAYFLAVGRGGAEDPREAGVWFRKAAEAGVRDSQFNLGMLYTHGVGVEKNKVEAYVWLSLAAGQGHTAAAKMRSELAAGLRPEELATARSLIDRFRPRQM